MTIPRSHKLLITGALLLFAALAWGDLVRRAGGMGVAGLGDMSMDLPSLFVQGVLFLGMWTTMMVAMMFPSVAPMLYTFATVYRRRKERGSAYVPTWVFLAGYLLVWATMGAPGFAASVSLQALSDNYPWLRSYSPFAVGGVVFAAGLYQLSPLKYACLSQCRSPLSFILDFWREGYGGALRMGLRHGWYCLGCCWLLFVALFAVGIMNLAWMGAVALLIFVEKLVPRGVLVSRVSGIALLIAGVALAVNGL